MRAGRASRLAADDGYAMAVLLIALAVMGVALSVAMPVWRTVIQREREEELIFRGKQYARAVSLYQRRFANAFPASFDILVEQKFLRRKYKDPVNANAEFQILYQNSALTLGASGRGAQGTAGRGQSSFGSSPAPGGSAPGFTAVQGAGGRAGGPQGGVIGVVSKNTDESIKIYDGHTHYNEWTFIYTPQQRQPGLGGFPGGRGGRGPGQGGGFGPGGMGQGRGQGGPGGGRGGGRGQGPGGGFGDPGGGFGNPNRGSGGFGFPGTTQPPTTTGRGRGN